jgi:hypothetical protein
MDNLSVSKRRAVVITIVVLAAGIALSPARVIVANVDGPPVSVEVVGVAHMSVPCPNTQTIWVPFLRVMPRDVVVTNSRDGYPASTERLRRHCRPDSTRRRSVWPAW